MEFGKLLIPVETLNEWTNENNSEMHDHTGEAQRRLGLRIKSVTTEGLSTHSPRHSYTPRGDIWKEKTSLNPLLG